MTDSKSSLTVTAPYDGAVISSLETNDGSQIEAMLGTAHALYRKRSGWLALHERIEILERAAGLMTERADALALQAATEGGKPLPDSIVEVTRAIESVRLAADVARTDTGEVIPMGTNKASAGRLAFTQKEPIGVVVAVSAFNHPLNLIAHQVAPAVAAGCPVVVKPSNDTPLSCISFVDILHEAGLPKPWCQVVLPAGRDLSEKLVTDSRVGFFSFIGSAGVGWHLRSKLAPGARCALEHGGVAPVILCDDANLDDVVPTLAKGAFYHAGQVCVSVQRIFAAPDVAEQFAELLGAAASKMTVGDPRLADTEVGPLIRNREADRVEGWIADAASGGAKIVSGGERISDSLYQPTVLFDPPPDATISTAEVFGPAACVYPVDTMEEAIERANALPYSFQASVFTRDIDRALGAYKNLDASAVMVNDHTAFRVDWMPFAGLRQSGLGVGGIPHTLHDMQIDKMMMLKSDRL